VKSNDLASAKLKMGSNILLTTTISYTTAVGTSLHTPVASSCCASRFVLQYKGFFSNTPSFNIL